MDAPATTTGPAAAPTRSRRNVELEPAPEAWRASAARCPDGLVAVAAQRGMARALERVPARRRAPATTSTTSSRRRCWPPIRRPGVRCVMTLHDYKLACPSYQMLDHGQLCDACVGGSPAQRRPGAAARTARWARAPCWPSSRRCTAPRRLRPRRRLHQPEPVPGRRDAPRGRLARAAARASTTSSRCPTSPVQGAPARGFVVRRPAVPREGRRHAHPRRWPLHGPGGHARTSPATARRATALEALAERGRAGPGPLPRPPGQGSPAGAGRGPAPPRSSRPGGTRTSRWPSSSPTRRGCRSSSPTWAGMPELVRDGVDGLVVAHEDPAALARALETLRSRPGPGARDGRSGPGAPGPGVRRGRCTCGGSRRPTAASGAPGALPW